MAKLQIEFWDDENGDPAYRLVVTEKGTGSLSKTERLVFLVLRSLAEVGGRPVDSIDVLHEQHETDVNLS